MSLPQFYFSRLVRAIVEFDLIETGDRILVGLSGGKDSLFLTYALAVFRKYSPRPFELAAFTLDPMFSTSFDTSALADFCQKLSVPFFTEQADIAGVIRQNQGKDPCFTCSFFRRGAVNRVATTHGFNKVAYAHHHDDAVETFLLSLIYSGQLKTFAPKTYLDRSKLTVIRPLIYFREKDLRNTYKLHGLKPIPSPCPLNGKTKRQNVKELIATLERQDRSIYTHLSSAMRKGTVIDLWPEKPERRQLKEKFDKFWNKPTN